MEKEIWKPIGGYEGLYEVSSHGNIRSLDRVCHHKDGMVTKRAGRPIKKQENGKGYHKVTLAKDSVHRQFQVHTLVARAFLNATPSYWAQVNHKDLDGTNNHVSNLEIVTPKENITHARGALRFCPVENPNQRRKLTPEQVREIRALYAAGNTQDSIAAKFGISRSYVSMLKDNLKWVNA